MPKDPVCGMNVKDDKKSVRSGFRGQTYHFCSDGCKNAFDQNPEMYANLIDDSKSRRQNKQRSKKQDRDDMPLV